jgi:hypothetical protein
MATKEQIKKAILDVAGNPDSGVIADFADAWADAIVEIDTPRAAQPVKETRVVSALETR